MKMTPDELDAEIANLKSEIDSVKHRIPKLREELKELRDEACPMLLEDLEMREQYRDKELESPLPAA
jgi:predicted RNase H-like nuclease (RuvC/YqgF family)